MLKRLCCLMICLLLMTSALAEAEIPTLPEPFVLSGLPKGMTFTVCTGPGENYYVANAGKAKVSTNDVIRCYGRVDDKWLMVSYEIGGGQERIGYISLEEYPQYMPDCRTLDFAEEQIQTKTVYITDDPFGRGNVIGHVAGNVTVLARTLTGGWLYVEGTLVTGEWARGFTQPSSLESSAIASELPQRANAFNYATPKHKDFLSLPDDALAEGMEVYPLADGTFLIAYRCEGSDRLWMRVISDTGKKLFAKSVPRLYFSQITLTDTGFICETFDNSEIDSGVRYTYTCKGRKWTSRKISYIEEPDRYYSDSTASYTVRRYLFGEGSVFTIRVTCNAAGAEADHKMSSHRYSDRPFLYEMDGKLLLCGNDETGAYTLRIYGDRAEEQYRIPMPEGMPYTHMLRSAMHNDESVYFYTGHGVDWQMWRLDRETMTFDPEPMTISVPADCTLTAIAPTWPYQLVLMDTEFTSILCDITPKGEMLRVMTLPGKAVWAGKTAEGFMVLQQDADGDFALQRYAVTCE